MREEVDDGDNHEESTTRCKDAVRVIIMKETRSLELEDRCYSRALTRRSETHGPQSTLNVA